MFYVLTLLTIFSFIRQRKKILKEKINLVIFIFLSTAGIAMGIIHSIYPYMPSLAGALEKYMK
jgi:tellurite resistance protein TehA-like permease